MTEPLVEAEALSKVFRPGPHPVVALRDVSLTVEAGAYVAITGASGSGKSTLMHILGCLDRPTTGAYNLEGVDVTSLSDRELSRIRRTRIGFVFQTFNLVPELDVLENVEMPFLYGDVSAREGRRRALEAIERVGLDHRLGHRPAELSGGEMQRVAIARAIAAQPALILADEPTGNLDSETGAEILGVFDDLHRDGVALVVVTHDPDVARRVGYELHMKDGALDRVEARA